ncbi:MAG TPA: hypothetical protein PLR41_16440 [Alphaproteobacteria bacterium]|nr:hypothetical protein [Alphaproteobacteria bacterium]
MSRVLARGRAFGHGRARASIWLAVFWRAFRLLLGIGPSRPEERLIRAESLSKHLQRDLGLSDVARPSRSRGDDRLGF